MTWGQRLMSLVALLRPALLRSAAQDSTMPHPLFVVCECLRCNYMPKSCEMIWIEIYLNGLLIVCNSPFTYDLECINSTTSSIVTQSLYLNLRKYCTFFTSFYSQLGFTVYFSEKNIMVRNYPCISELCASQFRRIGPYRKWVKSFSNLLWDIMLSWNDKRDEERWRETGFF